MSEAIARRDRDLGNFIPGPSLDDYRSRFGSHFHLDRHEGILTIRMHSEGQAARWSRGLLNAWSQLLREVGAASSSVSATIGRNVTQVRGTSVRPASRACSATRSICSRVSFSGSPIRGRALAVLDEHGIPATVVGEAAALGGVLNATRAGLGVSLLALAGPPPEGLVEVRGLPPARSISLTARARHGADQQAVQVALRVLQTTLKPRPSTLTSDLTGGRSGTGGAAAVVVAADRLQLTSGGNRMELLHSGKIREVYADGDDILLVASDRVSVYDVVLPTLIPDKGKILTQLSLWWFDQLADLVPNHVISATDVPSEWAGRAIRCRRLDMLPVECIARGYLAGLGLESYKATRTISGVPLPEGLSEGSELPEPVFTPTTKATVGHDEFIDLPEVEAAVGADTALELKRLTLAVYQRGAEIAANRGIIIADTKLEFGRAPDGTVVLADEVLTPDSSRFWSASDWQPGGPQRYLDKQFVRDWSSSIVGWDRKPPGPEVPQDIVNATRARYIEVYERLTGTQWQG